MGAFIELLKDLRVSPEIVLADKGYDSALARFYLREKLGAVGLIAINPRRKKGHSRKKSNKKRWNGTIQLTLDKFIPRKKRAKKYRKQCEEILKTREGLMLFKKRSAVERVLA